MNNIDEESVRVYMCERIVDPCDIIENNVLTTPINLSNFFFNDEKVRVFGTWENPLFIAKEVCQVLGLKNTAKAIKHIPSDYVCKKKVDMGSGLREVLVLNEPGMYELAARSNKPIAVDFRRWVWKVVVALRTAGTYKMGSTYMEALEHREAQFHDAIKLKDKEIKKLEYRL